MTSDTVEPNTPGCREPVRTEPGEKARVPMAKWTFGSKVDIQKGSEAE